MGARGRPLRFVALVLSGWTALRVVMLWPAPPLGVALLAPAAHAAALRGPLAPASAASHPAAFPPAAPSAASPSDPAMVAAAAGAVPMPPSAGGSSIPAALASAISSVEARPAGDAEPQTGAVAPAPPATLAAAAQPTAASPSRLQGDAYLVARGGRDGSLAFGQLGASQAGARLTYALDAARRLAVSARVAAPLHGTGSEVAAGLDWRPTALPVHLLVEDRYDIDAHRHEPAAELIAGVYARAPAGLTLDSYAQGGAVARRGAFADGAARLFRPVPVARHLRLELGAGSWGGAQRGAARLDVGPSASLALSGHGRQGLRAGLDYRVRVAGRASPGSGPAFTLGAGF